MKFELSIDLESDGAEFGNNRSERSDELARILRAIADKIKYDESTIPMPVHDGNGNWVGGYGFTGATTDQKVKG